jgi:hypothetical protein
MKVLALKLRIVWAIIASFRYPTKTTYINRSTGESTHV